MKRHLYIAVGLVMVTIFMVRGLGAMSRPGIGVAEIYILGGFILSGLLIYRGIKNRY